MEKEINNIEEYMLCALGVCGELRAKNLGKTLPFTDTYVLRTAAQMVEKGLIRKYEYPDAKFYKLSEKGFKVLNSISPVLGLHFGLLCGEEGNRYKGSKEKRRKKRRTSELAEMCLSEGYNIDLINLTQDKLVDSLAEPIDNVFEGVNPEDNTFLTNRMIYHLKDEMAVHPGTHMYRTTGVLLHKETVYATYYLIAPGERWWREVEGRFVSTLTQSLKSNYMNTEINPAAIFYTVKDSVLESFIFPEKREFRITPNTIYNVAYMIPLNKEPGPVTSLLLKDDWRNKVNELLIESPNGRQGDGLSADGRPVYNLLGCNIGLMRKTAHEIKAVNGIAIVHDWQVNIAKRMYGDVTLRVVESDMLKELIKDIDKMV